MGCSGAAALVQFLLSSLESVPTWWSLIPGPPSSHKPKKHQKNSHFQCELFDCQAFLSFDTQGCTVMRLTVNASVIRACGRAHQRVPHTPFHFLLSTSLCC